MGDIQAKLSVNVQSLARLGSPLAQPLAGREPKKIQGPPGGATLLIVFR
jgi:hypothetical protein